MKSLTKKALSLAMAIAMVGSFAVSATSVADVAYDETTVTVTYDAADVTDQLTVIAYEVTAKDDETTAPTDANIVYINQWAKGEAPSTITFDMRDTYVEEGAIKEGVYKVLIGGTGVSEMKAGYLVVEAGSAAIIWGDVDGDEKVTGTDAIMTLIRSGDAGYALANEAAADVDGDKKISGTDAIMILIKSGDAGYVFPVEQ